MGYYSTEEQAARVYDLVALAMHGSNAQTNFDAEGYNGRIEELRNLGREELQRALGVKPMDKSSACVP